MSAGLARRIEKLEEEAAREKASKGRWGVVWVTETGERVDAVSGERIADGGEGGSQPRRPHRLSEPNRPSAHEEASGVSRRFRQRHTSTLSKTSAGVEAKDR
jgi:hypothetical protein